MSEIYHSIVDYIIELVAHLGYGGIFLLMSLESSFVPFPSELVLIPAGVAVRNGEMTASLVILSGILGSLVGALINYSIAYYLGRSFIDKFGKFFLLSPEKFDKVEKGFLNHGYMATFLGRLIFGIRQWISLPAGLSKMPLLPFAFLTSLGAGIWVSILVYLGYALGKTDNVYSKAKELGVWFFVSILIISVVYYLWKKNAKNA